MKKKFKMFASLVLLVSILVISMPGVIVYATTDVVTWDIHNKATNILLSEGDLKISGITNAHGHVRATIPKSSGKWYWEIKVLTANSSSLIIGVANSNSNLESYMSANALGVQFNGDLYGSSTNWVGVWNSYFNCVGTVVGVALDLDDPNGTLQLYVNGVAQIKCTDVKTILGNTIYPAVSYYYMDTITNFGAIPFTYQIPTGFLAYNQSGEPVPTAPANLIATAGNAKVDLGWNAVTGATSYTVKRSAAAGGPFVTVVSGLTTTTYSDATAVNGTKYYYVVNAVNTGGESANSNEVNCTPAAAQTSINRGVLVITMLENIEKEFDLSQAEIDAFTAWYSARSTGTGNGSFMINNYSNIKPFLNRKVYVNYDRIVCFEVKDYISTP